MLKSVIILVALIFAVSCCQNETHIQSYNPSSVFAGIDTTRKLKIYSDSLFVSSTSFVSIPNLSIDLDSGSVYIFSGAVLTDTLPLGGFQFTIDGGVTYSHYFAYYLFSPIPKFNLGEVIGTVATSTPQKGMWPFSGYIIPTSSGTIDVQVAQVDNDGGTSIILPGSHLEIKKE